MDHASAETVGTKLTSMNARIEATENLMKLNGTKGATFEWHLISTNPMVKLEADDFCDDTDLVTKQKARFKPSRWLIVLT
jgi:hypothetical protein